MRRIAQTTLAALIVTALAAPASAQEVCEGAAGPRPTGPVTAGFLDGGLSLAHRACPRTEVTLGVDGLAVADFANYYGNIRVDTLLSGSYALTEGVELFADLGLFRYQAVISFGTIEYLGTGYLSLGAAGQVLHTPELALAVTGRLVLPTTSGLDRNSQPLGADVGVTATWAAHETVDVHGSAVFGGSIGVSAGPAVPRGTARVSAAVDWHPLHWLGIAAGLGAGFGYRGPVDMVAASLAFRFGIVAGLGAELAVTYPFVGEERALAAGFLRFGWRFEPRERGGDADAEPEAPLPVEPAEDDVGEPEVLSTPEGEPLIDPPAASEETPADEAPSEEAPVEEVPAEEGPAGDGEDGSE